VKDGSRARHTPTLSGNRQIRALAIDVALMPHLSDALTSLDEAFGWWEVGDSVDDVVAECKRAIELWYSDMLIGSVAPWLSTPPAGWLLLDGSTHAETDYPELFAVLDDVLKTGSDFTLPDTSGSFAFGVLDKADAGVVEGNNVLNLTVSQLPSHSHDYIPPVPAATVGGAGPPLPSVQTGGAIPTTTVGTGDDIDTRPLRFGMLFAVFAGRT
jgi:microcystin-dependent protein